MLASGTPFLTSAHGHPHWPLVGEVPLASAMAFDLGVYLAVVGATMLVLTQLGQAGAAGAAGAADAAGADGLAGAAADGAVLGAEDGSLRGATDAAAPSAGGVDMCE